jgi:hypothetical protein
MYLKKREFNAQGVITSKTFPPAAAGVDGMGLTF